MKLSRWLGTMAVALPLVGVVAAPVGADQAAPKRTISFGNLRTASAETARERSLAWLKGLGTTDAAALKQFDTIWSKGDRPILERVADTLCLGDPEATKLLAEARDASKPAPTAVPALLKDKNRPAFFRSNLALAYGKALSNRRVFEEALDAFRQVKPDQVVDPSAYFFHRAVAEHALLLKKEANLSIVGLLEDVIDTPDRYKMVALLMYQDMMGWRDKDLGEITRKMDNIERRLELARGGAKTQKLQREVVARLDEIIKRLEKPSDGNGGC